MSSLTKLKIRPTRSVLGNEFDPMSLQDAVDWILMRTKSGHTRIVFINTEAVIRAYSDSEFSNCLKSADLRLADGIGMQIGDILLNGKTHENVNGTDLFPLLCLTLSATNLRVFLLGGRSGIAQRAALKIRSLYPNIQIAGVSSGYFNDDKEKLILEKIKATKPHIILVGLGSPEQEIWLMNNLHLTEAKVGLGVGGLFDYYAGKTTRAPHIVRRYGMEWLWRLINEPWRYKRQLAIPKFIALIFFAKIKQLTGNI